MDIEHKHWKITGVNPPSIEWIDLRPQEPFLEEYEMSGKGTDCFIKYGRGENGEAYFSRFVVFPRLRTIPNNTHASFRCPISEVSLPAYLIDGKNAKEHVTGFTLSGILEARTVIANDVTVVRKFFPCEEEMAICEMITVKNNSLSDIVFEVVSPSDSLACRGRGTKGVYYVETLLSDNAVGIHNIASKGEYTFCVFYIGRRAVDSLPQIDAEGELQARIKRISELCSKELVFECGIPELDCFFALAKFRAGESIFRMSDGKLLHSPGGGSYYAATWCNDQVEYAGPHFALTADKDAMETSLNAYRHYMPFMDRFYTHIPSSVIAEGTDIWEGAGDRGDAAMYLYGGTLFVLYSGDKKIADEMYPALKWCVEYCRRNRLEEGVIRSDSDELEGRFPTDGRANLSTSMLCLGGLRAMSVLALSMGDDAYADECHNFAESLASDCEKYFAAELHGFETYRYSKGFDTLRAWISLPLCMNMKRIDGSVAALRSNYLRTENGLLSCELGEENKSATVWDRAVLYAYKGFCLCGKQDECFGDILSYTESRLLGSRVPYAIEAWPEGDKRHLSGESALFCRIITEGMLGVTPTGLHTFSIAPHIPQALPYFKLCSLNLCGRLVDVIGEKDQNGIFVVSVYENGKKIVSCRNGEVSQSV